MDLDGRPSACLVFTVLSLVECWWPRRSHVYALSAWLTTLHGRWKPSQQLLQNYNCPSGCSLRVTRVSSWKVRGIEGKLRKGIRFSRVHRLQLFRDYPFTLTDLELNKVWAALLTAGCTTKGAGGGSGPRVTALVWVWPWRLVRWHYVVTALRHLLLALFKAGGINAEGNHIRQLFLSLLLTLFRPEF